MDEHDMAQVRADIARLKSDTEEVRVTLAGDMSGKLGVMHHLLKLMDDVHGPAGDKPSGLKPRVEVLEQSRRNQIAWAMGAGAVILLLWVLIKFAFGKA